MVQEQIYRNSEGFPFLAYNQFNLINQKSDEYNKKLLDDIKNKFEQKDLEIKNSSWRKQKGYYVDGSFKRRILFSEGLIIFKRTRYKYFSHETKKWKRIFLVDDYLQIQKWQKWSFEFKQKLLNLIAIGGNKHKDLINAFPRANLHKSTISRFISKLEISNFNEISSAVDYKIPKDINKYNTVYISIDDAYANFKVNKNAKKFQLRIATFYLGVSKKPDERNSKLIHKRVICLIKEVKNKTFNFVRKTTEKIKEAILNFYGEQPFQIVVCGDGAGWIKSVADNLGAHIVLDNFHLKKEISNIFPPKKSSKLYTNLYKYCINALNIDYKILVNNYLIPLKEVLPEKADKIKSLIKYIKNNEEGILSYKKSWYNGCFTESNVYHFIKSITNSKSYSFKSFLNLMNLRLAWINNLDPKNVWVHDVIEIHDDLIEEAKYIYLKNIINNNKTIDFPVLKNKTSSKGFKSIYNFVKN